VQAKIQKKKLAHSRLPDVLVGYSQIQRKNHYRRIKAIGTRAKSFGFATNSNLGKTSLF